MTDEKLLDSLKIFVEQGNCFTMQVHDVLIEYKNEGGLQADAQKVAEQLRNLFSEDEMLEDRVLDILDIITGWCGADFRVWT